MLTCAAATAVALRCCQIHVVVVCTGFNPASRAALVAQVVKHWAKNLVVAGWTRPSVSRPAIERENEREGLACGCLSL